ncbi:MAG TPA: SDR family oxidoreductase [Casimicrobiaceae bacterium]|jgi:3-oxoacyl-[acyl-carrier protein] reductase|nr:SDR family oxidoreductase [Casimicrobiaceae bacterium]
MDYGIKGRTAIVCAASQGLGRGCALALAHEGVNLVINARTSGTLESTAQEIRRATGADVKAIAADITTREGRDAVLRACPDPDILVNNAGGPPIGDFRDWDEATWQAAVNANMITPIMLMRSVIDGMIARRFGRIVNITSRSVKGPLPDLGLSNGARTGLTGFVGGLARQVAKHNVVINNLLPGPFMTARTEDGLRKRSAKVGQDYEAFAKARMAEVPAGRFGDPDEFGKACAFLCSAHAGFIVGQNLLIDGGAVNVTI